MGKRLALLAVLGLAALGVGQVLGCPAIEEVAQEEHTGLLARLPDPRVPPPEKPVPAYFVKGRDGSSLRLEFASPALEQQAEKLVGRTVRVHGRTTISGLIVSRIEAAGR